MAVLPPDPVYVLRASDMGPVHSLCFHGSERLLSGKASGSVYLWDLQVLNPSIYAATPMTPYNVFLTLADQPIAAPF